MKDYFSKIANIYIFKTEKERDTFNSIFKIEILETKEIAKLYSIQTKGKCGCYERS